MRLVTELYHRQRAPFREVSIYFPVLNDISDGKNLGDLQFFWFWSLTVNCMLSLQYNLLKKLPQQIIPEG